MPSYHVYFDVGEGILPEEMLRLVHAFMEAQIAENQATGYRILHFNNKASFRELCDYHLIVDYASDAAANEAMDAMKIRYTEEPHKSLMKSVTNFKVAFSEDV